MKRMLITGAGGFIGKNMINAFHNEYEVTAVYRKHIGTVLNDVNYVPCDLSGNIDESLGLLSDDFDVILHFAGQVQDAKAIDYVDNTIILTKNVIEIAKVRRARKFFYASSISTYGYTEVEIDEDSDRTNPTLYGMSKTFCERMIEESGLNYVNLRLPRVLGRGMDYSYPWLPLLAKRLFNNEIIRYFNPELMYNNLLDIDDLVYLVKLLLNEDEKLCWTLSLGCSDKMSVLDIITNLRDCMNSMSEMVEVESRANTVFSVDISKAKNVGFSPMSVRETIGRLAEYALHDLKIAGI